MKPDMQWNVASFKNRSNAHGELFPAGVAFLQARTNAAPLILDASKRAGLPDCAAMWADNAIRPDDAFQLRKGGGFVVKLRLIENLESVRPTDYLPGLASVPMLLKSHFCRKHWKRHLSP